MDMDDGDPEHKAGAASNGLPAYAPMPSTNGDRTASPLPAPQPQRPLNTRRDDLDGETIFAVGDDDKDRFSSDESDGEGAGKRSRSGGRRG